MIDYRSSLNYNLFQIPFILGSLLITSAKGSVSVSVSVAISQWLRQTDLGTVDITVYWIYLGKPVPIVVILALGL